MQFKNLAENLLGSKVKVKLIRHLLSEEAITSEREIAKLIGVSHGAVNKALKELHEQNLITPMRAGNVLIWHLNKQSYAYLLLLSFHSLIKETPLDALKAAIKGCISPQHVKKAVIYGSVAAGTELPNSDIDLFILVESENSRRSILPQVASLNDNCLRKFGNKVSANIFTNRELSDPKNRKFLENVNRGIVVFEK